MASAPATNRSRAIEVSATTRMALPTPDWRLRTACMERLTVRSILLGQLPAYTNFHSLATVLSSLTHQVQAACPGQVNCKARAAVLALKVLRGGFANHSFGAG